MIVIVILTLTASVYGRKPCSRNANLMKSIHYQLKLVEQNDGTCDSNHKRHDRIGFMVTNSQHIKNIPNGGDVIYDTIITNVGAGYDSKTGIFKAPEEGLYSLSWTTLSYSRSNFESQMFLNENLVARNYAGARGLNIPISGTQSVVIYMKKEDKVSIKANGTGKLMESNRRSSFSGFLI